MWQNTIPRFATGVACADGKIFIADDTAAVHCYDEETGASLWNSSADYADYGGCPQVAVYGGRVYVSTGDCKVKGLDENTGEIKVWYNVPAFQLNRYKFVASFFIVDGRIFITRDSNIAVYDLGSEKEIWSDAYTEEQKGLVVYDQSLSQKSTFVYVRSSGSYAERIDVNTGQKLWKYPGNTEKKPLVSNDRVILWNFDGQSVICLSIDSGKKLWEYNVGISMFQPTIYNGQVLFGAQDGYFYALNLGDGTLRWRTNVDSPGLIKEYHEKSYAPYGLPPAPIVDTVNQNVIWNIKSGYDNSANAGVKLMVVSLKLQSGRTEWTSTFLTNLKYDQYVPEPTNMALTGNQLLITAKGSLFCINTILGQTQWEKDYDHYVYSPIIDNNKLINVGDTLVTVYGK
jgi:outer membrane protein assembly factor BamB